MEQYEIDAYMRIANAIIKQAADDWWRGKKKVERLTLQRERSAEPSEWAELDKKIVSAKNSVEAIEHFFESEYCDFISRGLGSVILEHLKNLYDEYKGSWRKYRATRLPTTINNI